MSGRAWLVAGFALAAGLCLGRLLPAAAQSPPGTSAGSTPAASQPASVETIDQARARLSAVRGDIADSDLALRAGIEFVRAASAADVNGALSVLDVVGYQPLPLDGPLPNDPPRPRSAANLSKWLEARKPVEDGGVSMSHVRIVRRAELRSIAPAVATWMLPQDFAVVVEPVPQLTQSWISRPACVVVRVRGPRATVVGGTLLDALDTR